MSELPLEPWIYLASASPRRAELLAALGVGFRRLSIDVSEQREPGESAEVYVERLALAKGRAGRALLSADDPHPVLAADTVVVLDNEVLGKPVDRDAGLGMLQRLSGREHRVMTALALVGADGVELGRRVTTQVWFRQTTAQERDAYWRSGEPSDKAGGYGIQGLGALFVEHIEGSYSAVVGLPVFELGELLQALSMPLLERTGYE